MVLGTQKIPETIVKAEAKKPEGKKKNKNTHSRPWAQHLSHEGSYLTSETQFMCDIGKSVSKPQFPQV